MTEQNAQQTETKELPQNDLVEDKLDSRREIYIKINWAGLMKAYRVSMYEGPVKAFDWATRNLDKASKPLMTGKATVVTMPLVGIPVRNGARMAHDIKEGNHEKTMYLSRTAGVIASGAAAYYTGIATYGWLAGLTGAASAAAKLGLVLAAAIPAAATLVPAFVVTVLGTAAVVGLATSVISVVPGLINIQRAWNRTYDAVKGVKYSEKTLKAIEEEVNRDSIHTAYEVETRNQLYSALKRVDADERKKVFAKLKEEFEGAETVKVKASKPTVSGPDAPKPN